MRRLIVPSIPTRIILARSGTYAIALRMCLPRELESIMTVCNMQCVIKHHSTLWRRESFIPRRASQFVCMADTDFFRRPGAPYPFQRTAATLSSHEFENDAQTER